MEVLDWISHNWFSLLQSVGIIGGLLFTGLALLIDAKERRNSNSLAIAQQHREHWANIYKRSGLSRVLDPKADLALHPVTYKEEIFILQSVVHLNTSLEVLNNGRFGSSDEALRKDIKWFFSLPIPNAVWEQSKARQDREFVRFVESCWN